VPLLLSGGLRNAAHAPAARAALSARFTDARISVDGADTRRLSCDILTQKRMPPFSPCALLRARVCGVCVCAWALCLWPPALSAAAAAAAAAPAWGCASSDGAPLRARMQGCATEQLERHEEPSSRGPGIGSTSVADKSAPRWPALLLRRGTRVTQPQRQRRWPHCQQRPRASEGRLGRRAKAP
jgi:hypothetical protein